MNSSLRSIILIIGTRPEAIKLIPVYFEFKRHGYPVKICATFQHTNLLQDVFDLFEIKPDFRFDIMRPDQDLFYLTQAVLENCKQLFNSQKPQLVIVQGDTTSAMAAALAAFYCKIPVAHIEAGLRTNNIWAPFPEELNRQFISLIATYNFAPTNTAVNNLKQAGVNPKTIYQVGNTVVDALNLVLNKIETGELAISAKTQELVNIIKNHKIILLTMHRRESFGVNMVQSLTAIREFANEHPEICFVFPVHPNPQVQQAIDLADLKTCSNIFLIESLTYHELIYVLKQAHVVVTDSGGISEEAASLSKPVILLRNETDRPEAVQANLAWLAGYDKAKIKKYLLQALSLPGVAHCTKIYGDGQSAAKIVKILKQEVSMTKVAVVGLGYIGLPTAIILAEAGMQVHGYDIDGVRVAKIFQGIAVIEEHELGVRLAQALNNQNFYVDTKLAPADYYIIAVPTPVTPDHKADLSYIWDAVQAVASVLLAGSCVIIESTVPVGTTNQIAEYLAQRTGFVLGEDLFVAFVPERVIPGKIFYELIHNDRLIGGVEAKSSQIATKFYAQFVKGAISQTDASTAEMVKLVENSSRDVQIAFANQVASMAETAGLDPLKVIAFANKHPRVQILNPGCGVGGHCIAVDPWFLIESFPEQSKLLQAARLVNDSKPFEVLADIAKKVQALQTTTGKGKIKLCVLGVTYKPDVDDLRNSPALFIAQELQKWPNIELFVVDPYVDHELLKTYFKNVSANLDNLPTICDMTVALVAHSKFKQTFKGSFVAKDMLDFGVVKNLTWPLISESK